MATGSRPTSLSRDPARSVREAMPEPVGMEQRGQQLHTVHQAGAGAVEVRRALDGIDRAGLDGRQVLPARAGGQQVQFGRRPVYAEAAGHEYELIRLTAEDALRGDDYG